MHAMQATHRLAAGTQWRFYPGYVYQLQQPAAVGSIHATLDPRFDFGALDEVMSRLVSGDLPSQVIDANAGQDPTQRIAHRLVHWVCQLQRQARIALSHRYRIVRSETPQAGFAASFELALPVSSKDAFTSSLQFVIDVVNRVLVAGTDDRLDADAFDKASVALTARLRRHALPGFNRVHMVNAAYQLDMPVQRVFGDLLVFGTGARSRIANSSVTDETPAIGMALAQDKWTTGQVLRRLGLPAPVHALVGNEEQAVEQAGKFGFPVVVKPANLDQGRGVAANLRSMPAVRQAFEAARKLSHRVLVERHFDGLGHRLTLYRGELIMALKRIPGGVTGDGQHSVEQLLELRRLDPQVTGNVNLGRVHLDDEAQALLAESGRSGQTVPAPGEFVLLRRRDNISAGGTIEYLTPANVHPDNLSLARRAARAVHLDLAGVDLLMADISVSWKTSGALICEVNGMPQFGPGQDGSNFERLLRTWVGSESRIPVALYWCPDAQWPGLQQALESLARKLGIRTVASRAGVWTAGECLSEGFASGVDAARAALFDRDVASLLVALTPQEVLSTGLPMDSVGSVHAAPAALWSAEQGAAMRSAMQLAGLEHEPVRYE